MIFNGPVEVEIKVMVVNDETNQSGVVTIGMGLFEYPSKESVAERIKKFEREELTGDLQGFRLMTKEGRGLPRCMKKQENDLLWLGARTGTKYNDSHQRRSVRSPLDGLVINHFLDG